MCTTRVSRGAELVAPVAGLFCLLLLSALPTLVRSGLTFWTYTMCDRAWAYRMLLLVRSPVHIHYNSTVELGVIIGSKARDVKAEDAMKHVAGYTLAIDMWVVDVPGGRRAPVWQIGSSRLSLFPRSLSLSLLLPPSPLTHFTPLALILLDFPTPLISDAHDTPGWLLFLPPSTTPMTYLHCHAIALTGPHETSRNR